MLKAAQAAVLAPLRVSWPSGAGSMALSSAKPVERGKDAFARVMADNGRKRLIVTRPR